MASKTNVSDYRFSIFINNDQAKQSLIQLESVMQGYQAQLQQIVTQNGKNSQAYRDQLKVIQDLEAKMVDLRKEAGLQSLTMKQLQGVLTQLNNERARSIPDTENYRKLTTEIQAVTNRMTQLKTESKNMGTVVQEQSGKMGTSFAKIAGAWAAVMAGIAAARGIIDFFKEAFEAAAKDASMQERMTIAFGGNIEVTKRYIAVRDQLNKNPFFTKEDIDRVIEMSQELGLTSAQALKVGEAAQALARYKDMPLEEAYTQLAKTLAGVKGRIGQFDESLGKLNETQLRSGQALDIIIDKFGKYADTGGKALTAQAELTKSMVAFKEGVGAFFMPAIEVMANGLLYLIKVAKSWTDYYGGGNTIVETYWGDKQVKSKIAEFIDNDAQGRTIILKQTKANYDKELALYEDKNNGLTKKQRYAASLLLSIYKEELDKMNAYANAHPIKGPVMSDEELKKLEAEQKKHKELMQKLRDELANAMAQGIEDEKQRNLFLEQSAYEKEVAALKASGDGKKETQDLINKVLEKMALEHWRKMSDFAKQFDEKSKTITTRILFTEGPAPANHTKSPSLDYAGTQEFPKELKPVETGQSNAANAKADRDLEQRQKNEIETDKITNATINKNDYDAERERLAKDRDLELSAVGNNTDAIKLIWAKYYKDLGDLNTEHVNKIAAGIMKYGDIIGQTLSKIDKVFTNNENSQLQKDTATNDEKKKNLDKRLKDGTISQKDHDNQVAKLDSDLDKKKRKLEHDQAVRQKEIALFNAIINMAAAIVSASTGGPGVGIALAIITAALDAIEVAAIASEPVPAAASGRYNVIGKEDGKRYDNLPYEKNPATGIVTKPMIIGETGHEIVINPADTRELQMNYPEVIQAIRYVHTGQRAAGAYDQVISTGTGSGSSRGSQGKDNTNDRLATALEKFNEHAEKGIHAVFNYDYWTLEMAKHTAINNDVTK